jgi:hypothetical protein
MLKFKIDFEIYQINRIRSLNVTRTMELNLQIKTSLEHEKILNGVTKKHENLGDLTKTKFYNQFDLGIIFLNLL